MEYAFHTQNKLAANAMTMAIDKLLKDDLSNRLTQPSLQKNKGTGMRSTEKQRLFQRYFDGNFHKPPVVVCIGSDLAIGDSLGPIVGSMLKYKTQGVNAYIYGTLALPVTAKEIKYFQAFLKETHPAEQIIAVDAAVGADGDIGLMRLTNSPLYPGAGANKKLGSIGDISVMGIVAEKSLADFSLFHSTRLHLVYSMAEQISEALAALLWQRKKTTADSVKTLTSAL